jgi:hypothetical protein
MKPIKEMTVAELAAFVQSHLRESGIDVVLSGGACVTFYSSDKYVSLDLDMIGGHFVRRREIRDAMREIGFSEEGRYFVHPETEFFIDFIVGPLAVGEEPVGRVDEHELATGTLRIISPTDCVKDRLAAYYHWKDLQSLEQASMVAMATEIDLEEVERWSEVEGKSEEFGRIRDRLVGDGL